MTAGPTSQLQQLKELFPGMPEKQLIGALAESNGLVERAVERILLTEATKEQEPATNRQPIIKTAALGPTTQTSQPLQRHPRQNQQYQKTWGTLQSSGSRSATIPQMPSAGVGAVNSPVKHTPKFVRGPQQPSMEVSDFPELVVRGPPLQQSSVVYTAMHSDPQVSCAKLSAAARVGPGTCKPQCSGQLGKSLSSPALNQHPMLGHQAWASTSGQWVFAAQTGAKRSLCGSNTHTAKPESATPSLAGGPRSPFTSVRDGGAASWSPQGSGPALANTREELTKAHPWAGHDLLEAMLQALGNDLRQLQLCLTDMEAPQAGATNIATDAGSTGPASVSRSAAAGRSRQGRSSAGAAGVATALLHVQPPGGSSICGDVGCGSDTTDDDSESNKSSSDKVDLLANMVGQEQGQQGSGELAGAEPAGSQQHRAGRKQQYEEQYRQQHEQVYCHNRTEALRLTRQWQKAQRRAVAAFAASDDGAGRALAAEARKLHEAVVEAHALAAVIIESEMNQGRGLSMYELDLHGLYIHEAVAAVERRLRVLGKKHQPHKQVAQHQHQHFQAPGYLPGWLTAPATNGAGVASPRDGAAGAVAAAAGDHKAVARLQRQGLLRVIVGKGNHSSDNEASIPRAVEAYLMDHGYKYTKLDGTIEVQFVRQHAGAGTGASASVPIWATSR